MSEREEEEEDAWRAFWEFHCLKGSSSYTEGESHGGLCIESESVPVQAIRLVGSDSEAEGEENQIQEAGFHEENRGVA